MKASAARKGRMKWQTDMNTLIVILDISKKIKMKLNCLKKKRKDTITLENRNI